MREGSAPDWTRSRMRILLIAHEFPPIPSAQSLRWAYLVRELALLGHSLDVLAPDHPGYGPGGGLPDWPESVTVHRTFPGLFAWSLKHRPGRARRSRAGAAMTSDEQGVAPSMGPPASSASPVPVRLNWKGRLVERLRRLYAAALFPDVRSEWNPWARRALRPLLHAIAPDVVIVSHEPASTLPLGLMAKQRGYRLVADLGDPVCAPYTPRRWRRRAFRLERRVCQHADLVTVTTVATRDLLIARHAVEPSHIHVMAQGFDDSPRAIGNTPVALADRKSLELLYAGSFYFFRQADGIVDAVLRTPGVRLNVASSAVPEDLVEAARLYPDSIRLLGFMPHKEVLQLQRRVDILVNLANDDPSQVPGKVYEYLGANRPILHIGNELADEAATLVARTGTGWVCRNDVDAITALLSECVRERRFGSDAGARLVRNEGTIQDYAWSAHAKELVHRISSLER